MIIIEVMVVELFKEDVLVMFDMGGMGGMGGMM